MAVDETLTAVLATITKKVSAGRAVPLVGFGSFGRGERGARTERKPQTGETLEIGAAMTVKFSAGKAFQDAVNAS